jgi:hypothetical protein
MRCVALCLAGLITVLAVGCQSKPAPNTALLKERAALLAKQVREAMTDPALMKLDAGHHADSGLRGRRQIEAALPLMRQLVECGKAADEPLWQLITDNEESVRRVSVILLSRARTDADGKPVASQTLIDLNIPLLERALTAKDAQVRYFACGGLGDFADWSDECLERVRISLPKLRELRNDSEEEVRSIGYVACNGLLGKLSKRAKTAEDRQAAADEWEQLQREKKW